MTILPDQRIAKSFVLNFGIFVIGSPWDNSFHVFAVDPSALTHIGSVRQKLSLLSTLNFAGKGLLLASWRDSSLTLWNLREMPMSRPLYRRAPHFTSVVDVDADASLGLIASLDKNRKCIFSLLGSGAFQRSFQIEGNDSLQRIMLFAAGYLLVLSQADGADASARIRVYGVNGRKIDEILVPETVTELCPAQFATWVSVVAVGCASGRVILVTIPDCRPVADLRARDAVVSIAFSIQLNCFVVGSKNGEVTQIDLT
jgi:hypothetical protein